jgi:hypothetical protein
MASPSSDRVAAAKRRATRVADTVLRRAARLRGRHHVGLHYPPNAENVPRYGHGRPSHPWLAARLASGDAAYRETLAMLAGHRDALRAIPIDGGEREPSWVNDFLPGLDGAAIYGFVRHRRPRHYLEIGSGHSTRFAARARRDGSPDTTITSIDPEPRAEVGALCDRVVRAPLEAADLAVFGELAAGDIVFFDGSHHVFMNNDVVAFFLDVLPSLPAGVLVGVHDIYLPDDYPPDIADRFYSEQYMLAAYLLGGADVEVVLPAQYVTHHSELGGDLDALWADPYFAAVERHGVAFWFSTT